MDRFMCILGIVVVKSMINGNLIIIVKKKKLVNAKQVEQ